MPRPRRAFKTRIAEAKRGFRRPSASQYEKRTLRYIREGFSPSQARGKPTASEFPIWAQRLIDTAPRNNPELVRVNSWIKQYPDEAARLKAQILQAYESSGRKRDVNNPLLQDAVKEVQKWDSSGGPPEPEEPPDNTQSAPKGLKPDAYWHLPEETLLIVPRGKNWHVISFPTGEVMADYLPSNTAAKQFIREYMSEQDYL